MKSDEEILHEENEKLKKELADYKQAILNYKNDAYDIRLIVESMETLINLLKRKSC